MVVIAPLAPANRPVPPVKLGVAYRARARPRSGLRVAVRSDDRERERAGRAIRVGAHSIQVKGAPTEMCVVLDVPSRVKVRVPGEKNPIRGAKGVPVAESVAVGRGKRSLPISTANEQERTHERDSERNSRMSLFPFGFVGAVATYRVSIGANGVGAVRRRWPRGGLGTRCPRVWRCPSGPSPDHVAAYRVPNRTARKPPADAHKPRPRTRHPRRGLRFPPGAPKP